MKYYACDVSKSPTHRVESPAVAYPFPLDPFQTHAIAAIDQSHNVLVCAKTGSGKTLVGEYQIAHSLREGKRVFYTTPIKSLSNQKFHDLKMAYPGLGQVGIMTGDIKFCPDAQIVIMTTEILRNLLYKQGTKTESLGITAGLSLNGLGAVIFDECHYINDKDRGKIWEETMILLPPPVRLVLLSATLDCPEPFAQWLSDLRQTPCALIQTQYRVVPLTHSVFFGTQPHVLMDAKEEFNDRTYRDWLQWRDGKVKELELYKRKVKQARATGQEGRIEGKVTLPTFKAQLNEFVENAQTLDRLPALIFVFSRKDCERYAEAITSHLLDSSDSALAERIFDFHLRHHKANLETLPQYHALRTLITRGISFHHSGVLPVLKEVIEILFSKGLVKLLFATETFAVGLNMPTKTVLFISLQKYDSECQGLRLLRTDEYIQMAGRAGRRGKDTVGYVYYLPEREPPALEEMRTIMKGGRPRVMSRMEFGYDFLLKTLHTGTLGWMDLMEKSYWSAQWRHLQDSLRAERSALEKRFAAISLTDSERTAFEEKARLEETVAATQNAKKKDALRALERWKDTHLGPKWHAAEVAYKNWKHLRAELTSLDTAIQANETSQTDTIKSRIAFLQEIGFVDATGAALTGRGTAATEFNEGHPILCTELAFRHTFAGLTSHEFVASIACFIVDGDAKDEPSLAALNVSPAVREALEAIGSLAAEMGAKEVALTRASDTKFWDLSTAWIEPVAAWLAGESISTICVEHGLFEGNFVRAILRVANLVDEWFAVATFLEDMALLEKMRDVRGELVRGVIMPDSLYLHL